MIMKDNKMNSSMMNLIRVVVILGLTVLPALAQGKSKSDVSQKGKQDKQRVISVVKELQELQQNVTVIRPKLKQQPTQPLVNQQPVASIQQQPKMDEPFALKTRKPIQSTTGIPLTPAVLGQ